jgi:hypothetical protein
MAADRSARLTPDNTNAWGHRLVGDTLVFECPGCDYGEVPVTDMIEEDAGRCPDCGAAYELHVEAVEGQ